ncbi:MAG: hypothetical protein VKK04_06475 [Synechococcales bacterium]|nr:hypothetical protein [Synechococcales bacterium]
MQQRAMKWSAPVLTGAALTFLIGGASPASAIGLVSTQTYTLDFEADAAGNSLYAGNSDYVQGLSRNARNAWRADDAVIGDQWLDWGVRLSADSHKGSRDTLLLYDSSERGQDNDLMTGEANLRSQQGFSASLAAGSSNERNLLIIQEGSDFLKPDDDAKGGIISFDFFNPNSSNTNYAGVGLGTLRFVDIDTNPGLDDVKFSAFYRDQDGNEKSLFENVVGSSAFASRFYAGKSNGDNSIWDFDLAALQGQFEGSNKVAISRLEVNNTGSGAIASLVWNQLQTVEDDGPRDIPEPTAAAGLVVLGLCAAGAKATRRARA